MEWYETIPVISIVSSFFLLASTHVNSKHLTDRIFGVFFMVSGVACLVIYITKLIGGE